MREEYPGKLDGAVQLVRELMGRDEVAEWRFSSRGRCFGASMGPFSLCWGYLCINWVLVKVTCDLRRLSS